MSGLPSVDWGLASRVAGRVPTRHPVVAADDIVRVVEELHLAADKAIDLVSAASGLGVCPRPPVFALDRASWARANTQLAAEVFGRLGDPPARTLRSKVAGRLVALVLGGGLAGVGRRIIGQFDPFTAGGRLLLVVPNVIATERALGVVPGDFRLWACLHEQTHAVQFAAAPWLIDELLARVRVVVDEDDGWGLTLPTSGPARVALDEVTAMMTFLEGHADAMMDRAGEREVASWEALRAVFAARRGSRRPGILARLGLADKDGQYARGGSFCRAVISRVGVGGLNVAFSSAAMMPSLRELDDPDRWIGRTNGAA